MSGRFGPDWRPGQGTIFRLWAPAAKTVELVLDGRSVPMQAEADGWHVLRRGDAGPGCRYRFRIDGEIEVPDPASHFQPEDVHGPSEVVDHAYPWAASDWRGRPWHEAVILELHVGSFTAEGTFRGAIERLAEVAAAGFTAIELMPVADFPGRWNWGYDGALLYAPDATYGRPADLKALVDAAHRHGLMVLLDVVYNHFGPDGNYLGRYAPAFFTRDQTTPWGEAIDYRIREVQDFAIDNALHWLDRYRFDGLRLDAVHAIVEPGSPGLLERLSAAVGNLARLRGLSIHLVLENDDNCARLLDPTTDPPAGRYRAQWNDDYHHAWHVLLTNERVGYYRDYADAPIAKIARSLASGYVYQGEPSAFRGGRPRGEPSGHLPPTAFVTFLQNHDQIGNRPLGERLDRLCPEAAVDAALAVLLLAPMPPLMFMGEPWGAPEPFPFFCDFSGALAEAVRAGRRREFAEAYADPSLTVPDPLAETTFRSAVLDWSARTQGRHARRYALVRRLLQIRHAEVIPRLAGTMPATCAEAEGGLLRAGWRLGDGQNLRLLANLSGEAASCAPVPATAVPIWGGRPASPLPPWSVHWLRGAW